MGEEGVWIFCAQGPERSPGLGSWDGEGPNRNQMQRWKGLTEEKAATGLLAKAWAGSESSKAGAQAQASNRRGCSTPRPAGDKGGAVTSIWEEKEARRRGHQGGCVTCSPRGLEEGLEGGGGVGFWAYCPAV